MEKICVTHIFTHICVTPKNKRFYTEDLYAFDEIEDRDRGTEIWRKEQIKVRSKRGCKLRLARGWNFWEWNFSASKRHSFHFLDLFTETRNPTKIRGLLTRVAQVWSTKVIESLVKRRESIVEKQEEKRDEIVVRTRRWE